MLRAIIIICIGDIFPKGDVTLAEKAHLEILAAYPTEYFTQFLNCFYEEI